MPSRKNGTSPWLTGDQIAGISLLNGMVLIAFVVSGLREIRMQQFSGGGSGVSGRGLPDAVVSMPASHSAPRVASRIATQFLMRCMRRIGTNFEGNAKLGVVFLTIAQATCQAFTHSEVSRLTGIRSMAESLSIPYETIRRCVGALVRAGLCESCGKEGVTVAPTARAHDMVAQTHATILAHYLRMLSELESIGFDFSQIRKGPDGFVNDSDQRTFLGNSAGSLLLRLLEVYVPLFEGNLTTVAVWTALLCANLGYVTYNRALTWKFGEPEAQVPDEVLRPVSALAVAHSLDMPFETTRRHVSWLVAHNLCVRVSQRGILVPSNIMHSDRVLRVGSLTALRLFQSLAELGWAGFEFPKLLAEAATRAAGEKG